MKGWLGIEAGALLSLNALGFAVSATAIAMNIHAEKPADLLLNTAFALHLIMCFVYGIFWLKRGSDLYLKNMSIALLFDFCASVLFVLFFKVNSFGFGYLFILLLVFVRVQRSR